MLLKQAILILITCMLLHSYCFTQRKYNNLLFGTIEYCQTDTGLVEMHYTRTGCKNYISQSISIMKAVEPTVVAETKLSMPETKRVKFLTIHGNVSYDFVYRSKVDTSYIQADLQQHTEKVWLDVMVKEKYPIKVGFTARQSNSSLFRNFLDANFQFDKNIYHRRMKQELEKKIIDAMPDKERLKIIEKMLEQERQKLKSEKGKLSDPSKAQQMIEEKEKAYRDTIGENKVKMPGIDITGDDSLINDLMQKKKAVANRIKTAYENECKKIDSLQQRIQLLTIRADSVRMKMNKDIFKIRQKLSKAVSGKELNVLAKEHGVDAEGKKNGIDKFLSSVNTLSIGRSMLDYTELTAQHLMISGINMEINPSYYAAFAAGKINYRFRDFLNRDLKNNNQYLLLGRFGIGDKNRKAVIFTLFQGRKNQSEFAISDTVLNSINITGYSVEMILRKDAFSFLSAEFAKSTKPFVGSADQGKHANALFKFSDERNMGINIKGETRVAKTDTRVSGYFRRTGHQFQSFSLFSYNSNQTAWQTRVEQVLWKNKVSITGMLRQNDFSNVFTEKTYKASTIFKSALLNVRVPKYPYLSLGYYPGTQLYIIDKDRIRENAYYILNGSLVYSYRYKGTAMTSSFMYNRYINQASDSGFILYKGVNYYASQNIFLRKLQLQGGYSYNSQPLLVYHSIDASGDVTFKKWLKAGAGIKYNTVKGGNCYMGQRVQLSVTGKWLGGLQLQYEKSYLPTISNTLFPVEMGRIMWFKNF